MIGLEQIRDGSAIQRNFETLANLSIGTGGRVLELRCGTDAVTFTAAALSAGRTVAHGLGRAPLAVLVTPHANYVPQVSGKGATNFTLTGYHTPGTPVTGTFGFDWLAVG